MINIGQNIRKIREIEKSYTQKYVADCLGITTKAYSNIENGVTDINFKRLEQISEVFECDPLHIINYSNNSNGITNHFNNHTGNQGTNVMNQYSEASKIVEHYERLLHHANEQITTLTTLLGKLK